MSFLKLCEKYFGSNDLYQVLQIEKSALEKEVRKAYHKQSLLCHPDRVEENQKLHATEKFKVLGKVHSILSDTEKRAVYDQTGTWDDDEESEFEGQDWMEYWRMMFKKITLKDIEKYEKEYKGSDDELRDLKKAYEGGKGDMDKIYEMVPFVKLEDEERIRKRIQKLIDAQELPSYVLFQNEPQAKRDRRMRKLKKEADEAEEECRKHKMDEEDSGLGDLVQAIQARRQASNDNFLDALEKRYSKSNVTKKTSSRKRKSKV
uniref:J domain-containing protein n=1 Tax=Graphocephala atropunctata TaxID=36148 RepID=A0A1B6KEC9_9HEMI